jgi:ABC-type Fe3+/spermidine/putrescine transport system ATPase subunit
VLLLDEPLSALDEITRRQVRVELADMLSQLALPTLLVTHAFDDALALATRIGVIDRGRILQLASPDELLAAPADAVVALHTGANVVPGVAVVARGGSVVRIEGGGELSSTTVFTGPVQVAIHPWELELVDPQTSDLVDTVVDIRRERGATVLRLVRFIVHASPDEVDSIAVGAPVGLRVAPDRVHLLQPIPTHPA